MYIDSLTGERVLTGETPKERAVIHMMQRRAEANLLDVICAYFHHATPGLETDIEGRQCSERGGGIREITLLVECGTSMRNAVLR